MKLMKEPNPDNKNITLHIEGMCCQTEVAIIGKKLKSLFGITFFEVNLMTEQIKITYNPSAISPQDIIRTIAETGMHASIIKRVPVKTRWWRERRIVSLLACGLFTLTAFILEKTGISKIVYQSLYLIAILVGGYYPAKMGLSALRTLTLNIRTLMVTGAIGASILGLWEEAALLVFIYSLGDVLEAYAVDKARAAIRVLMELTPKEALVKRDEKEVMLKTSDVRIGDIIVIRPGEKIPLDGKVIEGSSVVDQSPITGESIPVEKRKGDEVFAGSINQRGSLEVRITKLASETTLSKIIHSVEAALRKKSTYERFGEKFGKYYTPLMFLLAFGVTIIPSLILGNFAYWFYRGLVVLVVSCSCGIALSVPVAIVSAISNAARHGILFKGGAYLEITERLKAVVFDKTGTLTIGQPKVCEIFVCDNLTPKELLALFAGVELRSEHPLANAILRSAREAEILIPQPEEFVALPGRGAQAKVNGKTYFVGNERLLSEKNIATSHLKDLITRSEAGARTVVFLSDSEKVLGLITIADSIRNETKKTIQELKSRGLRVLMLTGDNAGTAQAIAKEVGVDEYFAQLLPEDKVAIVERLKTRYGRVAMVGDGINDAPAMAVADIGIAMGAAGTDVALETGDVALMTDDLSKIPYALGLSKRTVRNIKQNISVSLAIILFLVPAALAGWIGLVSGLLMNEIGGLIVILNSLRLLK